VIPNASNKFLFLTIQTDCLTASAKFSEGYAWVLVLPLCEVALVETCLLPTLAAYIDNVLGKGCQVWLPFSA